MPKLRRATATPGARAGRSGHGGRATPAGRTEMRRLSRPTRGLLVGFVLLTALATNQLYVLSAHTDA